MKGARVAIGILLAVISSMTLLLPLSAQAAVGDYSPPYYFQDDAHNQIKDKDGLVFTFLGYACNQGGIAFVDGNGNIPTPAKADTGHLVTVNVSYGGTLTTRKIPSCVVSAGRVPAWGIWYAASSKVFLWAKSYLDPKVETTWNDPQGVTVATVNLAKAGSTANLKTNIEVADNPAGVVHVDAAADGGSDGPQCEGGAFTWFICPAIDSLGKTIKFFTDNLIEPLLHIQPINPTDTGNPLFKIWSVFRTLANAMFVLVFLVIIFSNVFSYNISAYTVRRMIPRLVAAALFVQLSYVFSAIIIDIGNILGAGIQDLLDSGLQGLSYDFNGTKQQVGSGLLFAGTLAGIIAGSVALLTAVMSGTILLSLIAAIVGILTLFVVLMFRQILINILVVLAPIAFVAWILPNTEKLFSLWWKNFLRSILMYPIIILLIASGKIFSLTAATINSTFAPVFALVALVIPLMLTSLAMKWAGSFMAFGTSQISRIGSRGKEGVANNQRLQDRLQKNKESGLLKAQRAQTVLGDPNASARDKFKARSARKWGMRQSGVGFGTLEDRRLNAGIQSAQSQAIKDEIAGYENRNSSLEDLKKDAMNTTNSSAKRIAAIQRLAQFGGYDELSEIRQKLLVNAGGQTMEDRLGIGGMDDPSNAANAVIWNSGIGSKFGDLNTAAPYLTKGMGTLKTLTPAQLADMHHDAATHMENYINGKMITKDSQGNTVLVDDPTLQTAAAIGERTAVRENLVRAATGLKSSPTLNARTRVKTIEAVQRLTGIDVTGRAQSTVDAFVQTTPGGGYRDDHEQEILRTALSEGTKLQAMQPYQSGKIIDADVSSGKRTAASLSADENIKRDFFRTAQPVAELKDHIEAASQGGTLDMGHVRTTLEQHNIKVPEIPAGQSQIDASHAEEAFIGASSSGAVRSADHQRILRTAVKESKELMKNPLYLRGEQIANRIAADPSYGQSISTDERKILDFYQSQQPLAGLHQTIQNNISAGTELSDNDLDNMKDLLKAQGKWK